MSEHEEKPPFPIKSDQRKKSHPIFDQALYDEGKKALHELVDGFFDPYEMMSKEFPEAKLAADFGPTRVMTSGLDFANYLLKKAGIRPSDEDDAMGFLNAVGMFKTAPGMMLGKEAAKLGVSPVKLLAQRLGMADRLGDVGDYASERLMQAAEASSPAGQQSSGDVGEFISAWKKDGGEKK